MADESIVVLCSCPDEDCAVRIARDLVERRLAACVSRVAGLRSIYRWEGALKDEPEVLLIVKSTRDRYADLEMRLRALHPYELPEIIAFSVVAGSEPYLTWIAAETRSAGLTRE